MDHLKSKLVIPKLFYIDNIVWKLTASNGYDKIRKQLRVFR